MANKVVVVVDNSNVFIEGQKFSAKMKGIVKQSPTNKDPQVSSWRIDFGKLLLAVSNSRTVAHAVLVGSRPPQNDNRRHWIVEMWAFKNAYNPADQMAVEVDSIKPLDDIFNEISTYAYSYP